MVSATSAPAEEIAATAMAAPGENTPTSTPATPGPIACAMVGRTMPSKPLTAIRSDAGTSAGIHAE